MICILFPFNAYRHSYHGVATLSTGSVHDEAATVSVGRQRLRILPRSRHPDTLIPAMRLEDNAAA